MKNIYIINRDPNNTPQEVFDRLCESTNGTPFVFNITATMGWANIMSQIIHLKDELSYPSAGIALSAFAINYINKVTNCKLSKKCLEQGTECLKKLTEKRINSKANPSDAEKNWWNTFLEIWKKYMKKHLEQEHLLID